MTDARDPLSDTTPLGKSVEEVEADTQNRSNPSVSGEATAPDVPVVPVVVPGSNPAGSPGGGVMVNGVLPVAGVAGEAAGLQAAEGEAEAHHHQNDRDLDDTPQ